MRYRLATIHFATDSQTDRRTDRQTDRRHYDDNNRSSENSVQISARNEMNFYCALKD